jgi:hypothetical protein
MEQEEYRRQKTEDRSKKQEARSTPTGAVFSLLTNVGGLFWLPASDKQLQ